MNSKSLTKSLAIVTAGVMFVFSGSAQSAVIFQDDFSSGNLNGWQTISGAWSVVSFEGSNVAQATLNDSELRHNFSSVEVTSFTLNFDYGWQFGDATNTLMLGVFLLDSNNNGYAYTIRQAAAGWKYGLFSVTDGVATNLQFIGNSPSEVGDNPLASASLMWNGSTLTGYQNGAVVASATSGVQYGTFSQVALLQIGTAGGARFDNIVVDATAVPEPGTVALLGLGAIALLTMRRRMTRAGR